MQHERAYPYWEMLDRSKKSSKQQGGHVDADFFLLVQAVALRQIAAEVCFEVHRVLDLLKFGPSFIVHHCGGSFPNSDFPDTMACPEGHHAGHHARRGHRGSGFYGS